MPSSSRRHTVPTVIKPRFNEIVGVTDMVCRAHLTQEYAALARALAAALARRRPSPWAQGRAETWAFGVTYALGIVNFLVDPALELHLRSRDLCALVGGSHSACTAKTREIRRLLRISQLDPRWCLPIKLAAQPDVTAMLASDEHAGIKTDCGEIGRASFPHSYFPPARMSLAESDARFPPTNLAATLGTEYEVQCRQLCFGPYPSWADVHARFQELKSIL